MAVDEDLLDLRVAEQLLERAEPDRVAKDPIGDGLATGAERSAASVGDQDRDAPRGGRGSPGSRDGQRPALLDELFAQLRSEQADVVGVRRRS